MTTPPSLARAVAAGGSGTRRSTGIEKTAHHTATVTNDQRDPGMFPRIRIIAALIARRIPPPT